jgi:hypothetical protein
LIATSRLSLASRAIHLAHSARADHGNDFVGTEACARGDRIFGLDQSRRVYDPRIFQKCARIAIRVEQAPNVIAQSGAVAASGSERGCSLRFGKVAKLLEQFARSAVLGWIHSPGR